MVKLVWPTASPGIRGARVDPRPVFGGLAPANHELGIVRELLRVVLEVARERKFTVVPIRRADLEYLRRGARG